MRNEKDHEQCSADTSDELALVLVNAERERYSLPPLLLSALTDKHYDLVKRYAQTVISAGYRLATNEPPPSADRETVAKIIYDAFPFEARHGLAHKPKWVPNGNSLNQDEARRAAGHIMARLGPEPSFVRRVKANYPEFVEALDHSLNEPQTAPELPAAKEIEALISDFTEPDWDTKTAFASHRRSWIVQCLRAALSMTRPK